jgi:hypothetical protein
VYVLGMAGRECINQLHITTKKYLRQATYEDKRLFRGSSPRPLARVAHHGGSA